MDNPFLATISRSPRSLLANQRVVRITILVVTILAILPSGCSGGKKSIADLIQELKSANASVRKDALKELALRGPEANEAIPFVAEILQDSVRDNRYRAAKFLSKIGADSTAVPALALALKDPDMEIRYYVAKSLSVTGPEAEAAVPSLVEALKDKSNEKFYHYIIKTLRNIGPKAQPAVPALKEISQHPNESFRKDAAAALKSIETVGA